MMRRRAVAVADKRFLAAAIAGTLSLAACSGSTGTSTSPGVSSAAASGTLTVFAAASLTEAFRTIGARFESAHPGTKVTFSFGPSSGLATQVAAGAPADVFASASAASMQQVVDAGDAGTPATFAKNTMEIAIPVANPGAVAALADLAKPKLKVALCQPQVPCGTVAQKVFDNARITVRPVTLEPDVKAVLSKVTLGEVDAGVVYVTDVLAAGGKVKGIEIPADVNAATSYPIAPLRTSAQSTLAAAFVAYVLSSEGQRALTAAGFAKP